MRMSLTTSPTAPASSRFASNTTPIRSPSSTSHAPTTSSTRSATRLSVTLHPGLLWKRSRSGRPTATARCPPSAPRSARASPRSCWTPCATRAFAGSRYAWARRSGCPACRCGPRSRALGRGSSAERWSSGGVRRLRHLGAQRVSCSMSTRCTRRGRREGGDWYTRYLYGCASWIVCLEGQWSARYGNTCTNNTRHSERSLM